MDTILTTPQMVVEDREPAPVPRRAAGLHRRSRAGGRTPQHLRPLLALSRPYLRDRGQLRLHHPGGRRPRADLQPRPRRRRACLPQHLPASRRHGGAREEGQCAVVPLLLSRLVVQRERPLRLALRRGQLRQGALRRRLRRPRPGAAARELSRLLVRELRPQRRAAVATISPAPRNTSTWWPTRPRPAWRSWARASNTSSTPTGSFWPRTASTPSTASRCTAPTSTISRTSAALRMESTGSHFTARGMTQPRQRPRRDRVRLAVGPADRALGAVVGRGQAPR